MKQLRFRTRLILILSLVAIVPSVLLTVLWSATLTSALPFAGGEAAWERTASSGHAAVEELKKAPLDARQRALLDAHERELRVSYEQSRRYGFLASRATRLILLGGLVALILLSFVVSRVAGHLSRQLSRPLDEVVEWTEMIAGEKPLPPARGRGAPEFETLRRHMKDMASALETGRQRAIEAERLRAFRESAQRVAHELKNPLTPIRFAIDRLRREAPAARESIDVLDTESRRLERMARSFAAFGRMHDGPPSEVDMGDLAKYSANAAVPADIPLEIEIEPGLPPVIGNHDALSGALTNVLLNAADACRDGGGISVALRRAEQNGRASVRITVKDSGCGIPRDRLAHIWEPYVTNKPGGTGLGLAITRQAVLAHGGTVEAHSTSGEGTEITFTLPASAGTNGRSV